MVFQLLYAPYCAESEIPYIYALAEKFPDSVIETYNILDINEGEENTLPGEMPSITRALRRGEGFLSTGIVFVEGKFLGSISSDIEKLVSKIENLREAKQ